MKVWILLVLFTIFASANCLSQVHNEWGHTKGPAGFFPLSSARLPDNSLMVSNLSGLFRTTDSGETWKRIEAPIGDLERGLLCTANDGSLLICSNGDYRDHAYPFPIYKSTDFGESWTGSPHDYTCRLLISVSSKLIYAVAKQKNDYGYSIIFSTNNGDSWIRTEKVVNFENSMSDYDVSFDRDGRIYLRDFDTVTSRRIVSVSQDTGKTWQYLAYQSNIDSNDIYGYASYTAIRGKGNALFLTYSGVPYISYDEGVSWAVIERLRHFSNGSSAPRFVGDLEGNVLLITNQGPILATIDNGVTWDSSFCYSYPATRVKGDNSGNFYFYTLYGLYSYNVHNKKVTYSGVPNSTPKFISVLSNSELIAYNSIVDEYQGTDYSYYGSLSVTTENQQDWDPIFSHSYEYHNWDYISDLVLDSNRGIVITTHDFGRVLRSTDIGRTWSSLYAKSSFSKANISLYVSPKGSIYACSPAFGLEVTSNNGESWTSYTYYDPNMKSHRSDGFNSILESSHGITFAGVYNKLYRKPSSDSVFVELANITLTDKVRLLYETSLGDIFVITENNLIYISQDGGNTFVLSMTGMPPHVTASIEEIGNGVVVVGGGYYMYFRRKSDNYWTPFPMPSDLGEIVSLAYKSNLGLYVGTRGNGLWLCKNISDTITSNVDMGKTSNFDAYVTPNPIVTSSSIFLVNDKDTKVTLAVIDVNGRSISSPLLFNYSSSSNSVPFSDLLKKLPSVGQYYVSITSEYGSKMIPILIK